MESKIIAAVMMVLIAITACQQDEPMVESSHEIVGEWMYEYEIMEDGTKKFDNPYALLEFEYSDGFILKEDGTGNSIWFGEINDDFEWARDESRLFVHVAKSNGAVDEFVYGISNMTDTSMRFSTPKGHTYRMNKR